MIRITDAAGDFRNRFSLGVIFQSNRYAQIAIGLIEVGPDQIFSLFVVVLALGIEYFRGLTDKLYDKFLALAGAGIVMRYVNSYTLFIGRLGQIQQTTAAAFGVVMPGVDNAEVPVIRFCPRQGKII